VIFLDVSRITCLCRVLRRLVLDRGRPRADLPEGCSEGFDFSLLRWIWRYPAVDRPRVLAILERLDERMAVHRLGSRADAQRFLDTL
jgi:adenylate kinase family enzyme